MRETLLFLATLLLAQFSFAQSQDVWIRFYDSTTELAGYKDAKGDIKIPAKFEGFTRADSFYHIIAVHEKVDSLYKSYYLLKDGRKVGKDSVYTFDFTFDCESEGKIIFYDKIKDRVGFLDSNGVAIVPAIYNYVTPFYNGLAIALRNAKRKCWDERNDTTHCEHLGWESGEVVLINDRNEVLVDSLNRDLASVNWYSLRVNDPLVDTSLYKTFKGRNGTTYSFLDYNKEFDQWFYQTFLPTLTTKSNKLNSLLFDEITYWSNTQGWIGTEKNTYLKSFPAALTPKRFQTHKLKEIGIHQTSFNELIYEKPIYKKYLNYCGAHHREKYPLYDVMLTYYKKRAASLNDSRFGILNDYEIDYQEHFEFLRTESGYKLLGVSLKK